MRILLRKRIGSWRFALSIGKVIEVQGINSEIVGGEHILMWEFDITDLSLVTTALRHQQRIHNLPDITIARSHPGGGFHAYCFKRLPWLKSLSIVADTEGVDPGYVNMCAWRMKFTLRLTDKGQGAPQFLAMLAGDLHPDCSMLDLTSHVKYEAHTTKKIWRFGLTER